MKTNCMKRCFSITLALVLSSILMQPISGLAAPKADPPKADVVKKAEPSVVSESKLIPILPKSADQPPSGQKAPIQPLSTGQTPASTGSIVSALLISKQNLETKFIDPKPHPNLSSPPVPGTEQNSSLKSLTQFVNIKGTGADLKEATSFAPTEEAALNNVKIPASGALKGNPQGAQQPSWRNVQPMPVEGPVEPIHTGSGYYIIQGYNDGAPAVTLSLNGYNGSLNLIRRAQNGTTNLGRTVVTVSESNGTRTVVRVHTFPEGDVETTTYTLTPSGQITVTRVSSIGLFREEFVPYGNGSLHYYISNSGSPHPFSNYEESYIIQNGRIISHTLHSGPRPVNNPPVAPAPQPAPVTPVITRPTVTIPPLPPAISAGYPAMSNFVANLQVLQGSSVQRNADGNYVLSFQGNPRGTLTFTLPSSTNPRTTLVVREGATIVSTYTYDPNAGTLTVTRPGAVTQVINTTTGAVTTR